jgi:hypothetical protein
MIRHALIAALLSLAPAALAQQSYQPPRTPDGRPDFQGNWITPWTTTLERGADVKTLTVSLEDGEKLRASFVNRLNEGDPLGATYVWDLAGPLTIGGEIRSSFIVDPPDGRLPYTEEGRTRRAKLQTILGADGAEQRSFTERCLMAGSGYAPFLTIPASNLRQIVQTRDHLLFFTESFGQLRIVPLDGGLGPALPRGGSSKAHWDADTLVIETTGFLETDRFRIAPQSTFAISPATRITERLTRTGADEILYRFTVEDPSLYTRAWTAESALKRTDSRVFEWACHEANYSLTNILRGARMEEQHKAGKSRVEP